MPLKAGDRVGPYEIRSLLGAGGMGEVYRAHDASLGRDVALKLLPAECADDPDRLRRFEQEARSASALNHPAIVGVYALGRDAAQPYIAMELVEGETLRQILAAGAMPVRRALQVAAQVADGLAKAHDAGIAHRDLKPENVMVSRDGFAKILDFGLAKLAAAGIDGQQTVTGAGTVPGTVPGTVLGTVGYMSPEQASGQPADRQSDQFAFGVILYEMLSGRRAFARATPVETLSAIIREEPTPMGQLAAPVPAPVRWIVERCLAKQPSDRYASTRDLARDLAAARDGLSELTGQAVAAKPARAFGSGAVAWALVAALAATTVALWLRPRSAGSTPDAAPVRFAIQPPASELFALNIGSFPFAVSPDGRQLAIVTFGSAGRQIWLRALDSLEPRPLAHTENASNPFWSPDGTAIGFFADGVLKRLTVATGEVSVICEVRGGRRNAGSSGAWGRDGTILFAGGLDVALSRVPASGGLPTAVTTLDAGKEESAHLSPLFFADDRRFLFRVFGGPAGGIYAASLDSAERTRIMSEPSPFAFTRPDRLIFIRDRVLYSQRLDLASMQLTGEPVHLAESVAVTGPTAAFDASPSGTLVYWSGSQQITQPTWLRRDGTVDGTLGPRGAFVNLAISPDGKQVAIDRFDPQPAIWLLDVARGNATRATFGNGLYQSTPVWYPDGSGFVYAAGTDVPPNLFLKKFGAPGDDTRVFRSRLQSFPQSWPSSGQIVYVSVDPKTSGDIWMVPAAGDQPPTPLLQTPFYEGHPRVSPDGRWLAYQSDESGAQAIYVTAFPQPRGKWQVSAKGGTMPVWSRNGRELFYRALDGMLMSVPVRTGTDFDTGAPVALFKSDLMPTTVGAGTTYDVAPDGRFLYNKFVERTMPPATVVVNWPGTLPREK